MRKGFLFILMVVALVALAVPVAARAPIIEELPSVIIGDAEDQLTADTAVRLMRFPDIFDMSSSSWIEWRNGLADADKHVYYTTSDEATGPLYLASNLTAFVTPMTAAQVALLEGGTEPGGGEITTDGTFFWVSLMNDAIAQEATTPPTNAYTEVTADNGTSIADYPAGSTGTASERTVTLYAIEVESFPTTAGLHDDASFVVTSVQDHADQRGAGVVELFSVTCDGGDQDWVHPPYPEDDDVEPFDTVVTTEGWLGIDCTGTPTKLGYGFWQSSDAAHSGVCPVPVVSADGMTGRLYRARAVVHNETVSSGADCPQYRLRYSSMANSHQGGAWVITRADDTSVYAPTTGNPVDLLVYWELPLDLSECGDSEKLATLGTNATVAASTGQAWDVETDGRAYWLQFDAIDAPAQNDDGVVAIESLDVISLVAPATQTPTAEWGGSGTAFNAANDGFITTDVWGASMEDAVTFGFGYGYGNVTASNIELGAMASGNSTGYIYASTEPGNMTAATKVPCDANKLVRTTIDLSSSAVNETGMWRILVYAKESTGAGNRVMYMEDWFMPTLTKSLTDALGGPTFMDAPAVPKAAGSIVSVYYFTHDGGPSGSFLHPHIDTFEKVASRPWTAWPKPTDGHMTITSITMESLDKPVE